MIGSTREDAPGNSVDAAASGSHGNSDRRLCTVDQAEQLKSAVRILPIWSSSIFLALAMSQNFPVLQADAMDRRVGGAGFRVPRRSLLLATAAQAGAGRRGHHHVGVLARAAVRDRGARRGVRRDRGDEFYTELPKSMASFSMSLLYMAMGVGNLVGSLIVKVANEASRRVGKTSWLVSNVNGGRYDYCYWPLAGIGAVNFIYFLWCGWAYGEEGKNVEWGEEGERKQPMVWF